MGLGPGQIQEPRTPVEFPHLGGRDPQQLSHQLPSPSVSGKVGREWRDKIQVLHGRTYPRAVFKPASSGGALWGFKQSLNNQ